MKTNAQTSNPNEKKKQQTDPYFATIRTLPKHHVKTLSA